MIVAQVVIGLLGIYAGVGLLFGVAFVVRGVGRMDAVAADSGVGFRLMILPGVAALWPVLLVKWVRGRKVA